MKYLVIVCLFLAVACKENTVEENTKEPPVAETASFDLAKFVNKDYIIDDQHSYIGFKIKYFGFSPVRGRFDTFDGTVFYDPEFPQQTRMTVIIDVASINTGNERRDNDLITEAGWFNQAEHPQIKFNTTSARKTANNGFELTGIFEMNGVSKTLAIPFEQPTAISRDWAKNEQVDYSGRITINRKDYGVEGGEFWDTVLEDGLTQLSDEVEIELDIHTRRADYEERYLTLEPDNPRKLILDEIRDSEPIPGLTWVESGGAVALDTLSSGAITTIGRTLLSWENYNEAFEVFAIGHERFPEKASFQEYMGITRLLTGMSAKAEQHFLKAKDMLPENTKAMGYLQLIEVMRSEDR